MSAQIIRLAPAPTCQDHPAFGFAPMARLLVQALVNDPDAARYRETLHDVLFHCDERETQVDTRASRAERLEQVFKIMAEIGEVSLREEAILDRCRNP
jgi:hypothetical protein